MRQPWEFIADALRGLIVDRTYKPGDQLPSEHQLADQYDTSRPTIRRALRELRLRGLIQTQQGKGAFVRTPSAISITLTASNYRRHQQQRQPGFNAQVREQGYTPRQEILEVITAPAPLEVADRLGLEEGANVITRRLRLLADDQPVQLATAYYEATFAAGSKLERPTLIAGGAHAELRRLGATPTRLVEDFRGARLPNPEEEHALRLPSGVPILRNIRTAYAGDRPVEVLDTTSHGEAVAYRFEIEV